MYTLPPSWAKVPIEMIFDQDFPDPVFRTVCRLLAASHEFRYQRSPRWTIMEMAAVAQCSERTMWGHLSVMRESVHVRVESPHRGHYVLHWLYATANDDTALSAKVRTGSVVVDHAFSSDSFSQKGQQQQVSRSLERGVRGESTKSAKVCTLPDEILQRLAELGWAGSVEVVEDAWDDDPERVEAWLDYWRDPPGNGRVYNKAALFRRSLESGALPAVTQEEKPQSRYPTCPSCYHVRPADEFCSECGRCPNCCECE